LAGKHAQRCGAPARHARPARAAALAAQRCSSRSVSCSVWALWKTPTMRPSSCAWYRRSHSQVEPDCWRWRAAPCRACPWTTDGCDRPLRQRYLGAGIDTNIIGRWMIHNEPEPEKPHIRSIVLERPLPWQPRQRHWYGSGRYHAPPRLRIRLAATYENMYTQQLFIPWAQPRWWWRRQGKPMHYALRAAKHSRPNKPASPASRYLHLSELCSTAVLQS